MCRCAAMSSRIAALGLRRDGPRRHLPADRRLAARRLDRPRARPAASPTSRATSKRRCTWSTCNARPYSHHDWHWRLLVAHRFGHAASAPTVHGALRLLDEAGHRGRAGRARDAQRARRGHADVGPPAVGARGVPPPARAVAMARVLRARAADLLFGSRVQGDARGRRPRGRADRRRGRGCASALADARAGADVLVVDLTDRRSSSGAADRASSREEGLLDGVPHARASTRTSTPAVRERAEQAGFDLVVPRSRMAREGAELVSGLAGELSAGAARPRRRRARARRTQRVLGRRRPGPGRADRRRAPSAARRTARRCGARRPRRRSRGARARPPGRPSGGGVAVAPLHQRDDRSATGRGPSRSGGTRGAAGAPGRGRARARPAPRSRVRRVCSTLRAIPRSAWISSKRRSPSNTSRTISSDQRSPTTSSAPAMLQVWFS